MSATEALRQLEHLNDDEMRRVLFALIEGQAGTHTELMLDAFLAWQRKTISNAMLLGFVLDGDVCPSWDKEEQTWSFNISSAVYRRGAS